MTNWQEQLEIYLGKLKKPEADARKRQRARDELHSFDVANHRMVQALVHDKGPDDDPVGGARMVANISAAHVPAFCKPTDNKPYKNGYDLKKYRVGAQPPEPLKTRELVDSALPLGGESAADVYFGAVDINGSGIRFYGDICFVLKRGALTGETRILDRNSYDLVRAPLRTTIDLASDPAAARAIEAAKLAGTWKDDVAAMSALKVLRLLGQRNRRYTIGQISENVCDDEDYIEVLKIGTFGASELQEARLSAAEAAHDALTGDRLMTSYAPRMESLMWRSRRKRAETALRHVNVRLHVVTTSGRTKD